MIFLKVNQNRTLSRIFARLTGDLSEVILLRLRAATFLHMG